MPDWVGLLFRKTVALKIYTFDPQARGGYFIGCGQISVTSPEASQPNFACPFNDAGNEFFATIDLIISYLQKAAIARYARTLSTMFAAGVPLVEALDSVGGASGNYVYLTATKKIQQEVATGTSLTISMQNAEVFPNMVLQMCAIGEESGALDSMLAKAAEIYEREVDEAVDGLSSLLEPMIMVILSVVIGGLVIAMYLPIFKLGAVV